MLQFIRTESTFVGLLALWFLVGRYFGPVTYAFLPVTLLALRSRDMQAEIIMGFIFVLIISDMSKFVWRENIFRSAKNIYVVLLAFFYFSDRDRFQPSSGIFPLFLPFFLYSIFPLFFSNDLSTGIQKTLSYALLFLIVPNYVLLNFRRHGWGFFRNLIHFMTIILLLGVVFGQLAPDKTVMLGRFHGIFGNPNGMAIYCYLLIVLAGVVNQLRPDLFTRVERILVFGIIIYCLIRSGSRASMAASLIFFLFNRFFSYSPFLGFVVLLAIVGVSEVISQNIGTIVMALGLEEFFRLRTLEGGSGRYFAWEFAWGKIQEGYLVFGGGFANDETVMRQNYDYLERMGHQGGVHNSYLSMWFNVGIVGLLIYFRSFILLFIKAVKQAPMSLAVMFSVLFSITYESWLVGSLNPYTIVLVIIMTVLFEPEIVGAAVHGDANRTEEEPSVDGPLPAAVPV